TVLFSVFAGLAVCLAIAGIYGVMAFTIDRRSSEIGLRIALGASTGSVVRLVLGQGLALAGIGLVLGLAASIASTRLLRTMLFQVQPNDPTVYMAVALMVGVVTLAACYLPATRGGQDRSSGCIKAGIDAANSHSVIRPASCALMAATSRRRRGSGVVSSF